MGTFEELADRLALAGKLLDAAAADIRDLPLHPARDHIRTLADAMTKVFEVQRAIFVVRPDLEPAFQREQSPNLEANNRLTVVLGEAYGLVDEKRFAEASALLRTFASAEPSEQHRRIAESEAERIGRRSRE